MWTVIEKDTSGLHIYLHPHQHMLMHIYKYTHMHKDTIDLEQGVRACMCVSLIIT